MRNRTAVRAFVPMLVIALATACTNADDASARRVRNAEDSPSVEAFASDYQALTGTYQERVEGVRQRGESALDSGPQAVLQVYRDLLSITEDAHTDYQTLQPPPAIAPTYERLVDNLGRQAKALRGLLAAAEGDDPDALTPHLEDLAGLLAEWGSANQLIAERLARDG